jgi:hypothetical protein
LDEELTSGNVAAALITGMKGAQMGPAVFRAMPRWLLEWLVDMAMRSEDKKGAGDDVTIRSLAPTLRQDCRLVAEASGKARVFGPCVPSYSCLAAAEAQPT